MHNPEACFDALSIIKNLVPVLQGIGQLEIQRSAYLACLLAIYDGKPLADWGYRFAKTAYGTPFSSEINDALEIFTDKGIVVEKEGKFELSEYGLSFYNAISKMVDLNRRSKYTETACDSTLLIPPSILSEGIDNEPTMKRALQKETGGGLLQGSSLQLLYDQFAMLSKVVDRDDKDLLTPSVIWISFISNQSISKLSPTSI